jgi:hypothetical protein
MTFSIALAAAVLAASLTHLAPADEYFGRMKMSVLEIGNRLSDLDRRAHYTKSQDIPNIIHDAGLTRDAIRDWQRKYPADPWLIKDITKLRKIYALTHHKE